MRVNETFISLQGEGHFTGTPAFFLRLSGCNLQCPFCDTNHQAFREMSEDEIVREASRGKPRHIVITGGEPALQLTQSLVDKLHEAGFFIQVETNGTLPLPEGIDWVTCSPKRAPLQTSPQGGRLHVDELKVLYKGIDDDPERFLESRPQRGDWGFRVATKCGYGPTKGSKFPLATEADGRGLPFNGSPDRHHNDFVHGLRPNLTRIRRANK
jgi:hypothetical protein